jgi:peptide/nickel transport system substrate-binding protein
VAPDPSWFTAWFTPDQVGQWNWERWSNAEFGELHTKALSETDPGKRATMYRRMQDLMDESAAYRFITHGVNSWTYDDALDLQLWPDAYQPVYRRCKAA